MKALLFLIAFCAIACAITFLATESQVALGAAFVLLIIAVILEPRTKPRGDDE